MLGQLGAGQRLSDTVGADVGDPAQTVQEAEGVKDAGIDADAAFDALLGIGLTMEPMDCWALIGKPSPNWT